MASMTLEQIGIFMVYVAAQTARKHYKYVDITTEPDWIMCLVDTRAWLHSQDIRL